MKLKVNKLRRVVDRTLILYLIIGILNFIVCTALMFFLYNFCGFGDNYAPLVNYGLGSLIWYLSCKFILFRGHQSRWQQLIRFVAEVVVLYVLSYYVIAPLLSTPILKSKALSGFFCSIGGKDKTVGNCEMSIGAVAYALLNYFGQRYFVFSDRFEHHRKQREAAQAAQTAGEDTAPADEA